MVLDSPHTPEVKEQALCIIGNIAAGSGITDYIMGDERTLYKLIEYMVNNLKIDINGSNDISNACSHIMLQGHSDAKLQEGAMFAIKNLIDKSDMATAQRLLRLKELGIVDKLEAYLSSSRESSRSSEE